MEHWTDRVDVEPTSAGRATRSAGASPSARSGASAAGSPPPDATAPGAMPGTASATAYPSPCAPDEL